MRDILTKSWNTLQLGLQGHDKSGGFSTLVNKMLEFKEEICNALFRNVDQADA